MYAFNAKKKLKLYQNPNEILLEFLFIRYEVYRRRKEKLLINLESEIRRDRTKIQFIREVCNKDLLIYNRKKVELIGELTKKNYPNFYQLKPVYPQYLNLYSKETKKITNNSMGNEKNMQIASLSTFTSTDVDSLSTNHTKQASLSMPNSMETSLSKMTTSDQASLSPSVDPSLSTQIDRYDYLLNMPISSMTRERMSNLERDIDRKEKERNAIENLTIYDMWMRDIEVFELEYERYLKKFEKKEDKMKKTKKKINLNMENINENVDENEDENEDIIDVNVENLDENSEIGEIGEDDHEYKEEGQ
jgi:DNA topoisomerase-2